MRLVACWSLVQTFAPRAATVFGYKYQLKEGMSSTENRIATDLYLVSCRLSRAGGASTMSSGCLPSRDEKAARHAATDVPPWKRRKRNLASQGHSRIRCL